MSKIINLFSGPGAGKSTIAAGLFYELKIRNRNVELALEFAKDLVWEGRQETLKNQLYVLGKQYHRITRLHGQVEAIITDSPLLLGIYYSNGYPESFSNTILDLHGKLDNINFFIEREKPYRVEGRNQTAAEAAIIDLSILDLLESNNINYTKIPGSAEGLRQITDEVLKELPCSMY